MRSPGPVSCSSRCPFTLPLFSLCLLIAIGAGIHPSKAEAQLRIVPFVGAHAPLSDLGELRDEAGTTLLELGRSASSAAFGVGFEVGGAEGGLGARLGLAYAGQGRVPIRGFGCSDCAARGSLLSAGGGLLLRPLPRYLFVQPHFVIGGGYLWYGFDDDDLRGEGWDQVLVDQRRRYLELGAGTTLHLRVLRPQVELRMKISGFDPGDGPSELSASGSGGRQGNLYLTVAIPLGG